MKKMLLFLATILIVGGILVYFLLIEGGNNGMVNLQEDSFCEEFSDFKSGGGPIPFPDYQKCVVAKGIVGKDVDVCNEFSYAEYHSCVIRIALETKNLNSCDTLEYLNKDECIKNVGIGQKNPDICNSISDLSIKNNCISEIAINNDNLALCNQVSDPDWCVINTAVETSNPNMCSTYSFSDPIYKDICISRAVSTGEDLILCEQILTSNHIYFCEKKIAIEIGDIGFCEGNDECIKEIAINTKDLNLCNSLVSGVNSCLRNVKILKHFDLESDELYW